MSCVLIIGWISFFIGFAGALIFVGTCFYENKKQAAIKVVLFFTLFLGIYAAFLLLNFPLKEYIIAILQVPVLFVIIIISLRFGKMSGLQIVGEQKRIDEREAIFHRFCRLEPGSEDFNIYYHQHPDQLNFDNEVRSLPHLAEPGTRTYHPMISPYQSAMFDVIEKMTHNIDWEPRPVEDVPVQISATEATQRIKGFGRYVGADLIGTTRLNPYYIYSNIGRSPGHWGDSIELNHKYGIAIGVEMDYEMIRHTPDSAASTETAFKYYEVTKVAMILARYINILGYNARAHVDGNYRVPCVPIAADAGLGELGRLGLLITPTLGPRLRLAVVTTDLPLLQDSPVVFGVQDFCTFCKKCAVNCPSGAISKGDKEVYKGVEKWQSNQGSCYRFWRSQGTDCAVCVRVCPYSHPGSVLHNGVRRAIRRNHWIRRMAYFGDNLFYGKKPKCSGHLPSWHTRMP